MSTPNRFSSLTSIVVKQKYIVIMTFLATILTVVLGLMVVPPVYESSSSLLIKFGREYMYSPEVGDANKPYNYYNPDWTINTELKILTSYSLAENLVRKIGIEHFPSTGLNPVGKLISLIDIISPDQAQSSLKDQTALAKAVNRFKKDLSIRGASSANIINVTYRHRDRETVATVVNTLVELYKENHLQIFSESSASAFFERQVEVFYTKLKESQQNFENFKRQTLIFSFDDQQNQLLQRRADLQTELQRAERQMIAAGGLLLTMPELNPVIAKEKAQLLTLRLEELELLGKNKAHSPRVIETRKKIKLVEKFLDEISNVEVERARRSILLEQIDRLDEELMGLASKEKEFRKLQRDVTLNEENYQKYKIKLEDYNISKEMDQQKISNIRVIQRAPIPVAPVFPKAAQSIISGLLAGLMLGVGLAYYAEYMQQRKK